MDLEPVELVTADGVLLRGLARGDEEAWVVLVHDEGADLDSLAPLAEGLADARFATLAVDLRGHGASDGEPDFDSAALDVQAALDWARAAGAAEVFLVAAGAAGEGALVAGREVGATVLFSPRVREDAPVRERTGPKLLLAGAGEPVHELSARLIGPRLVVELPTPRRGHELLAGDSAPQALGHSIGFIMQARTTHPRAEAAAERRG
jgi:pimeloyl-ACP methyl ester carboxylesterase